jgi:hypothetical protein
MDRDWFDESSGKSELGGDMPGKREASRIRIIGVTTGPNRRFSLDRWKFGTQGMPYKRFSELAEILGARGSTGRCFSHHRRKIT